MKKEFENLKTKDGKIKERYQEVLSKIKTRRKEILLKILDWNKQK